jgi:predicted DNA-binding transcriptional regulator YafY
MGNEPKEGRGTQIRGTVRLFEALLTGKPLTRKRAAEILGTTLATADRQLREIRKLKGIQPREGQITLDRALLFDTASYPTVVAACLMAGLSRLFRGTEYERGMKSALKLVLDRHPKALDFQHLERKFFFAEQGGEASLPAKDGALDDVVQAILKQQLLQLSWLKFDGSVKKCKVEPLSLVVFEHQLYVIVKQPDDAFHAVRFSRILSASLRAERFAYPANTAYDPAQLLSEVFGIFVGMEAEMTTVELRLSEKWKTYAETHRWHPTQKLTLQRSWLTLTMHLRPCHQLDAWILSFGPDIEVIEPPWLREKIAGLTAKAARKYKSV